MFSEELFYDFINKLWFYSFEELKLNLKYGGYIFLMPQTFHQPRIEDLTQAWLLSVDYIKDASELLKGSINPVLFRPPYLKLLQFNIKITSKTTCWITSSKVNLVRFNSDGPQKSGVSQF